MVDGRFSNPGEVQSIVVSTLIERYRQDSVVRAADIALPVFVVSHNSDDGILVPET